MMSEPRKNFSKPRDESLQAFKDWINGMYRVITGKSPERSDRPTSEADWIARWKKFWRMDKDRKA